MNDPEIKFVQFLNDCETECTDLVLKNYCNLSFDKLWQLIYHYHLSNAGYDTWLKESYKNGYTTLMNDQQKIIKIKFSQEYKLQYENPV